MKSFFAASAVAALVGGCAMYAPPAAPTPEAANRLAQEIGGRIAGTPQNCVRSADLRGNRSIDERTILFDGPPGTIWVNRPRDGCPLTGMGRAIRTRTTGTQICAGDIAHVFDPVTGIEYGACALGAFTPYRRP